MLQEIPKTPEQEKVELAQRIVRTSNDLNEQILLLHTQVFNLIWESTNPQELFDLLGLEQSILLFQTSSGLQQLLKVANPEYEMLVPPKVPNPEKLAQGVIELIFNPQIGQ